MAGVGVRVVVDEPGDGVESAILGCLSAPVPLTFEAVGKYFQAHAARARRTTPFSFSEFDDDKHKKAGKAAGGGAGSDDDDDDDDDDDGASTGDMTTLEPGDWKDQDHYTLLGISSRWKATQDDIKKAYRKAVLKHHPDKKSPEELGSEDDQAKARAFFTCIQQAYDVLSDPAKRLLFDSVDPFDKSINDDVPGPVRDAAAFYKVFGPAFERNARWLKGDVPALGGDDASHEEVMAFYNFWYAAKSWRDFGYYDEEDPSQAESREEKRYIERFNRSARKKKKKEENARILRLIDNAYSCDPRLIRFRENAKKEKAERQRLAREKKEAEEKARVEAKRREEEERERVEKEAKEAEKQKNEDGRKARRAFTKACKRAKLVANFENPDGKYQEDMLEEIKAALSTEELKDILAAEDFEKALADCIAMHEERKAKEKEESRPWTAEEQSALENAMRTVPKDMDQKERWKAIAALVPGRSRKECVQRVKHCAAVAKKIAAQPAKAPKEWTKEELAVLVKAASKVYPPGTQGDRYGQIAEYVHIHGHTEWTRSAKDVIAQVNSLKNVANALEVKKNMDDFEQFQEIKKTAKDKSVPSESVPSERTQDLADVAKDGLAMLDELEK